MNLAINFRPVSLLPIFSKIFEQFICCVLKEAHKYRDLNQLVSNIQFGFRNKNVSMSDVIMNLFQHFLETKELKLYNGT